MDSRSKALSLSDINGRGELILSVDQTGHILTVAQARLLRAHVDAVLTKYDEEVNELAARQSS